MQKASFLNMQFRFRLSGILPLSYTTNMTAWWCLYFFYFYFFSWFSWYLLVLCDIFWFNWYSNYVEIICHHVCFYMHGFMHYTMYPIREENISKSVCLKILLAFLMYTFRKELHSVFPHILLFSVDCLLVCQYVL